MITMFHTQSFWSHLQSIGMYTYYLGLICLHMQRQASSAARVKGCCSRFLWLQMFKLNALGVGRTVTNHDRAFEEV
jgi:hypothetical protein